jgi:hypothetical protein
MPIKKYLLYLCIPLFVGCSSTSLLQRAEIIPDKNIIQVQHDSQNGITFIGWPPNSNLRLCKAPAPDVLSGQGSSISFAAPSLPGATGNTASVGSNFEAAVLGGRSPSVLIARDYIYRACELSANLNLSKEETLQVYQMFLEKAQAMANFTGRNVGSTASQLTAPSTQQPNSNFGYGGYGSGSSSNVAPSSSGNPPTPPPPVTIPLAPNGQPYRPF